MDVIRARAGRRPDVARDDADVLINVHLRNGVATVSIDLSGASLHQRTPGRRTGDAPLKETLAAAILRYAGYDGTQPFLDPMCGSGTLAIEAAMIAVDKAPQIHRHKGEFNFEWLEDFDRTQKGSVNPQQLGQALDDWLETAGETGGPEREQDPLETHPKLWHSNRPNQR